MTVYDGERHLAEAVESILGQSFADFEFVVVDDGSTDRTPEILQGYDDARLRVLSPGRLGRAGALNHALAETTAPLVALMDADDVSLERRLERQVEFLASSSSVAVCSTWLEVIDEAGHTISTLAFPTRDADLRRRFLRGNPIGGPASLVRREVFDRVGGFREEYVPSEDHDLWRRALPEFGFATIPEVLLRYRTNPGGLSHRHRDRQAHHSSVITADIRRRPFPVYGARQVLDGARFYGRFASPEREQLLDEYARDQARISTLLLRRGRLIAGLRNTVGTLLIRPAAFPALGKPQRAFRMLRQGRLRSFRERLLSHVRNDG
jgi:glycosyltransferase involved in cell wall biosynthesis